MQLCSGGNWTHDLLISGPTPYRCAIVAPIQNIPLKLVIWLINWKSRDLEWVKRNVTWCRFYWPSLYTVCSLCAAVVFLLTYFAQFRRDGAYFKMRAVTCRIAYLLTMNSPGFVSNHCLKSHFCFLIVLLVSCFSSNSSVSTSVFFWRLSVYICICNDVYVYSDCSSNW